MGVIWLNSSYHRAVGTGGAQGHVPSQYFEQLVFSANLGTNYIGVSPIFDTFLQPCYQKFDVFSYDHSASCGQKLQKSIWNKHSKDTFSSFFLFWLYHCFLSICASFCFDQTVPVLKTAKYVLVYAKNDVIHVFNAVHQHHRIIFYLQ